MSSPQVLKDKISLIHCSWPSADNHTEIADDVDGRIYANVTGFYAKFFESKSWFPIAKDMAHTSIAMHHLNLQSREHFALWLRKLPSCLPAGNECQYMWLGEKFERSSSLSSEKTLVLLRPKQSGRELSWTDVLVIGQTSPDGTYLSGLSRLCDGARTTFASQPDRLFIHGFYICGTGMELWIFDRAGIYSCQVFDILQTPTRFFTVLAAYTLMLDQELGLGPLIKHDHRGEYVELRDPEQLGAERLDLGAPIFERVNKNIIGDGLTCYRAKQSSSSDWEYAIKLKWSSSGGESEVKMLQRVKERKPWGVLHLFTHQIVFSTASLHEGLIFGTRRKFENGRPIPNHTGIQSICDHTLESPDVAAPENTTLSCIAISPLGTSLHRFQTIPELLHALTDAIRAHHSLYLDAGILHQDICPGNIIIPCSNSRKDSNSPRGFLIDLDSAKEVSEPYTPFQSTGTPPFHAIGVLQAYLPNNPHTYRHDLESFFYTFIFLASCPRPVPLGENQLQLPATSPLRNWTQGRPVDQARRKIFDMSPMNFSHITDCFTSEFKSLVTLAENLRGILFPERGGEIWTGTDMTLSGTNILYDQMIQAFDKAASCSGSPQC